MVLILSITPKIFAQEVERLTFTEFRSDGILIGNVTVNAIFLLWTQQNVSYEGDLVVTYEKFSTNGSDWSDWELLSKQPALMSSLSLLYNFLLRKYNEYPRGAIRIYFDNGQAVRIHTIPVGHTSPYWWSKDGRSYNVMYKFYVILP